MIVNWSVMCGGGDGGNKASVPNEVIEYLNLLTLVRLLIGTALLQKIVDHRTSRPLSSWLLDSILYDAQTVLFRREAVS